VSARRTRSIVLRLVGPRRRYEFSGLSRGLCAMQHCVRQNGGLAVSAGGVRVIFPGARSPARVPLPRPAHPSRTPPPPSARPPASPRLLTDRQRTLDHKPGGRLLLDFRVHEGTFTNPQSAQSNGVFQEISMSSPLRQPPPPSPRIGRTRSPAASAGARGRSAPVPQDFRPVPPGSEPARSPRSADWR